MAQKKFLDENGLLYFWQKIKNYVTGVTPTKQSDLTNDDYTVKDSEYSTVKATVGNLETKFDQIVATGGEPNVLEIVKVNNTALTNTGKSVNITVTTGTADGSIKVNGEDVSVAGLGSAAYTASTAYDAAGTAQSVYTTNSAGYQTASQVSSAISSAISGIQGITYEIVQTLPATGNAGTIYLISNSGSNPNSYDEYIYVNNAFEKIGTTDVDLSGYVQTSDLVAITNGEIDTITTNSNG